MADGPAVEPRGDAYGGLSILRALARLFEWRDLAFTRQANRFVADLACSGERAFAGRQAD